jgi:hypothetical protein
VKESITKKRAGGVAQGVDPEFNPQYCKKNIGEEGWYTQTAEQ